MPNHVTNVITLLGNSKKVKSLLDAIKCDEANCNSIDFNKVIPMPKSLEIEASSSQYRGIKYWLYMLSPYTPETDEYKMSNEQYDKLVEWYNRDVHFGWFKQGEIEYSDIVGTTKKEKELGKIAIENLVWFGHTDWYGWRRSEWGTKWNAYDFEEREENQIVFHTAWSPSYNVTQMLSKMFPTITIKHQAADEFYSEVFEEREYNNGEVTNVIEYELPDTKQQWLEIHGYDMTVEEYEEENCYMEDYE